MTGICRDPNERDSQGVGLDSGRRFEPRAFRDNNRISGLDPLDVRYQVTSTTRLSPTKYNPLLPPAISVIATASEEQENHNDNQNGCHSFLQNMHRGTSPRIWVRNNYVTSPRNLPSAAGGSWLVCCDRRCAHHRVVARLVSYKHLDDAEWWRFTLDDNAALRRRNRGALHALPDCLSGF